MYKYMYIYIYILNFFTRGQDSGESSLTKLDVLHHMSSQLLQLSDRSIYT